jgi:DNA-binding transcriptional ArsR family regulator
MAKKALALSLSQAARLFMLLGDESRLRILLALAERGELTVSVLARVCGQSQSGTSHNLRLLYLAEVVGCRRQGQFNYYSLTSPIVRDLLVGVDGHDGNAVG